MNKKKATIRRWIADRRFGFCNYYTSEGELQKYFVHYKNATTPEVGLALGLGVRILFVDGPARTEGELPTALEIEILSGGGN
jgi:hypothetical protein